jgi:hypothetical protein
MSVVHRLFGDDDGALAWPELAEEALHSVAGRLVELATNDSEADPAGVLLTTLTWASAVFGAEPIQYVGDTPHYGRLFTVLVGQTSKARKGTTIAPVKRILTQAEILDPVSQQGLKKRYGGLSSAEGLIYAVRDPSSTQTNDGYPVDEGVTDKRLLCIETEFGKVFRTMQRQGNTIGDILKQAWDGGDLGTLTKESPLQASNPHINIIGHITGDELSELLTPAVIWSGLGNRFLWCCVRRNGIYPDPARMPDDAVEELACRLRNAFENAKGIEKVDWADDEVKKAWAQSYERLSTGGSGAFGAMTGRSEAQVRRLAMVYALLDCTDRIDLFHLKAAEAVWHYCDQSAEYLFGAERDPLSFDIAKVMRHFENFPNAVLTKTEMGLLLGKSTKRRDKVVRSLLDAGVLESEKVQTGGAPKTLYCRKRKKGEKA